MNKDFIKILSSLALSLALSGCFLYRSPTQTNIEPVKPQPETTATTTLADLPVWPEEKYTEDDYKEWKTYKNEILGYTIKHPSDWIIKEHGDGPLHLVTITPPDPEDFIAYVDIGLDTREIELIREVYTDSKRKYRTTYPEHKPDIESKIDFNGLSAFQFVSSSMPFSRSIVITGQNEKPLSILTQKDSDREVRQVLASFRFTENMND